MALSSDLSPLALTSRDNFSLNKVGVYGGLLESSLGLGQNCTLVCTHKKAPKTLSFWGLTAKYLRIITCSLMHHSGRRQDQCR